ncbi:MAG: methyltransferase [Cyanobacteria bacterium P01_A01_bin.114]
MTPSFPIAQADERILFDISCTRVVGPVITLAQELRLFDLFQTSAQSIEEVAQKLNTTPLVSEAFVAVLASVGLLQRQPDERFRLTPMAETYMLADSPFFFTGFCPPHEWYLDLLRMKVMGSGPPPMPMAVNMKQHSQPVVQGFIHRMHMMTLPAAASLANQPVFSQLSQLLDVGGGSGSLSLAIAAFNPQITCTVMDLPMVCEIARQHIESYGLPNRVHTLSRDMFRESWPSKPDAILFGNVFHDWDIESCRVLAQQAFNVLKPGGKILLHEMPLAETRDGPLTVACLSAILLMYEKGKQYTLRELENLLSSVGFVDFQSTPTHVYYHLISATKPSANP